MLVSRRVQGVVFFKVPRITPSLTHGTIELVRTHRSP